MSTDNNKLKSIISDGSELAGSAAGGALGFFAAGPIGAAGGAAGGTLIAKVLNKIGSEIHDRVLGRREKVRIGAATIFAIEKIQMFQTQGVEARQDGFFSDSDSNRSAAEEILEGVYLKSKASYEEKKVKYYGYFFANIAFDSNFSVQEANYFLNLYENLTYRQLCLTKIFCSLKKYSIRKDELKGKSVSPAMWTVLQEIYELVQLNLIRQIKPDGETDLFWGLGAINSSKMAMTRLGLSLVKYFDLENIPEEDLADTIKLLE